MGAAEPSARDSGRTLSNSKGVKISELLMGLSG